MTVWYLKCIQLIFCYEYNDIPNRCAEFLITCEHTLVQTFHSVKSIPHNTINYHITHSIRIKLINSISVMLSTSALIIGMLNSGFRTAPDSTVASYHARHIIHTTIPLSNKII